MQVGFGKLSAIPLVKKLYTALRESTIRLTVLADRQRFMTLMRDVELGDRSPSQLLRHMGNLIGNCQFDDGFVPQAFLVKLPPLVQTVLAAVPASATIRELADEDSESHAQPLSVASVTSPLAAKPLDETASLLLDEVRAISLELQNLKLQVQRIRSRSNSRSHSRPSRHENNSGLCWYHQGGTPSAAALLAPFRETGIKGTKCVVATWRLCSKPRAYHS